MCNRECLLLWPHGMKKKGTRARGARQKGSRRNSSHQTRAVSGRRLFNSVGLESLRRVHRVRVKVQRRHEAPLLSRRFPTGSFLPRALLSRRIRWDPKSRGARRVRSGVRRDTCSRADRVRRASNSLRITRYPRDSFGLFTGDAPRYAISLASVSAERFLQWRQRKGNKKKKGDVRISALKLFSSSLLSAKELESRWILLFSLLYLLEWQMIFLHAIEIPQYIYLLRK